MNFEDISWTEEDDEIINWDKLDSMTNGQILSNFSAASRMVFERFGIEFLYNLCVNSINMAKEEMNEINNKT